MNHPFIPEYIRMAIAAEEIQAMRPTMPVDRYSNLSACPGMGSFFISNECVEILHWDNDEGRWIIGGYSDREWTWLPRLDQLLEMLGSPEAVFFRWAEPSGSIDLGKYLRPPFKSQDWHGLALEVVMLEKFAKRWDRVQWYPSKTT